PCWRSSGPERPDRREKGGIATDPADWTRGAEADPPAGVGPTHPSRASAGMIRVEAPAPAAGARGPLPQARSETARLTTAVGLDRRVDRTPRRTPPGCLRLALDFPAVPAPYEIR